jgi:hypothetical protein
MAEIDLLKLVLTATQQKKLNWKQDEGQDRYFADVDRYLYSIEYQNPVLTDGKRADVSLISVTIASVLITCAEGTPLAELVEQILAAAFQDWADTARFVEEGRVEAAQRLVALINGTTEDAVRLFSVPPTSDWTNAIKRFKTNG